MKKIQILEGVRGFAALYVLLHHLVFKHGLDSQSRIGVVFRFGQEAVMLFFLLSGFVIYFSSFKHHDTFGQYFVRRWRRIYPIFLISLAITYASVSLSLGSAQPLHGRQLLGNILMLQDFGGTKPGVWFSVYYGNSALWSLSYEWCFYLLFFPLSRYVAPALQKYGAFFLSACGLVIYWIYPNQICLFLLYFSIWWTGVEIAKVYCAGYQPSLKRCAVPVALLGALVIATGIPVFIWRLTAKAPSLSLGTHPVLELRHFAFAWVMVLASLLLSPRMRGTIGRVMWPFTLIAPISYALYVFHVPLAVDAGYLRGALPDVLQLPCYVAITFLFAWLAEGPFQRQINRWVRVPRGPRTPAPAEPGPDGIIGSARTLQGTSPPPPATSSSSYNG